MKKPILILAVILVFAACESGDDSNRVVGELASDRIEMAADVSEPIIEIAVAEGDAVEAGQILLRQDDARAVARLAAADAVLAQAQARLDELIRGPRSEQIAAARAEVEGATQELDFRNNDLERTQNVFARGLASPDVLDRAKAAQDAAQASLKSQLARLEELLTGTTVEELAQAEQIVKQADAQRSNAQIDVERHALRAPGNGIVDSRLFELGERPVPGQPVMIVLAGEQPYARVYVPEHLRVSIRPGTKAWIHVDGLNEPVAGRVRWVASESAFTPYFALTERDRGRLSYVAKVDISEERERLPDGVPVEVEFLLESDH
jgi:HlyD family secretion protein